MKISLNDAPWTLQGFWPNEPLMLLSMETGHQFLGATPVIPATVPGGVHADLLRAGLIEDPYFELNSLKCEWVENRWWVYAAKFLVDPAHRGRSIRLVFTGVDYHGHFYLNGQPLGEHEGMFTPAIFDVSDHVSFDADNELKVAIESAPPELSQIGHTSKTSTQKCRFTYKWDFSTRLVNLGLWDDVHLDITGAARFAEHCVQTDLRDGAGVIDVTVKADAPADAPVTLTTQIFLAGHLVDERSSALPAGDGERLARESFTIAQPEIWHPHGAGEQPLYRVVLTLREGETVSDACELRAGIRSLAYRQNEDAPAGSLPYTFVVNGQPVYLRGVNFTPADHLYGTVNRETYRRHLALMRGMNVNLIRVWGGGLIEKEAFYDLCDEMGFLVWQEFIQSSSGIENVPSKLPRFLELLREAATHALKVKRNHVSLTVWSGGNELMDAQGVPATCEDANLAMLQALVAEHDGQRLFLPTSASGPRENVSPLPADRGRNHDVHGHWKYLGSAEHYRIYGDQDSQLHSEFGVDGCAGIGSLRKFLSPANLRPASMKENLVWRHHGEWWDVYDRQREFFGEADPADLARFALGSQFVQAEGLRYIVEANRRRQWRNSGSIIWQFNEPWPNASCTSLVDYYFEPKMAYHAVQAAFAPLHASLSYRKLRYAAGEAFEGAVHMHNSAAAEEECAVVQELLDSGGKVLRAGETRFHIPATASREVARFDFAAPETADGLFFVRLRWIGERRGEGENVYTFSKRGDAIFAPLLSDGGGDALEMQPLASEGRRRRFALTNRGDRVRAAVHPVETTGGWHCRADRNYLVLFPGETREVAIHCEPRAGREEIPPQFVASSL